MKKNQIFLLFYFLCLPIAYLSAQKEPAEEKNIYTHYTYITDRQFKGSDDLLGYTFIPAKKEVPDGDKRINLAVGQVAIGVSLNYLYIKEGDKKKAYSMNAINPEQYGFKLALLDAQNPAIQGHLKIILNKWKEVEALIFKEKNDAKEVVFHLPSINEKIKKDEDKYFTDKYELECSNPDSLWGKRIKPFFKIGTEQKRVHTEDSLSFNFLKRVTITIKGKDKKSPDTTIVCIHIPDSIKTIIDSKDKALKERRDRIKTKTEQVLRFRFLDDDGGVGKVVEQDYTVKNMKVEKNKDADGDFFTIQVMVKELGTSILLHTTNKGSLSAIELPSAVFLLRDKKNQIVIKDK